jgi:hypothetical protein
MDGVSIVGHLRARVYAISRDCWAFLAPSCVSTARVYRPALFICLELELGAAHSTGL